MLNNVYGSSQYYPPTTYPTGYSSIPPSTYPSYLGSSQPTLINGRAVDNEAEITAGEVPLNGSLAVFPKKDGSMIYVKSTNGNGTIDTRTYIPAQDDFVPPSDDLKETPSVSNEDIMTAISNLQNQIDGIQRLVKKRPRNNKYNPNKETTENE